jgi:hypothetical protein
VYAAHPITCYGTEHATGHLARLAELLPYAEIVDPETFVWRTHDQWRRSWPSVLDGLAGLVVFAALDGTVGAGCIRELTDAVATYLPIASFHDGALREIDGLEFLPVLCRSPRRTARLLFADPIDPTEFVAGEPRERTVS